MWGFRGVGVRFTRAELSHRSYRFFPPFLPFSPRHGLCESAAYGQLRPGGSSTLRTRAATRGPSGAVSLHPQVRRFAGTDTDGVTRRPHRGSSSSARHDTLRTTARHDVNGS